MRKGSCIPRQVEKAEMKDPSEKDPTAVTIVPREETMTSTVSSIGDATSVKKVIPTHKIATVLHNCEMLSVTFLALSLNGAYTT